MQNPRPLLLLMAHSMWFSTFCFDMFLETSRGQPHGFVFVGAFGIYVVFSGEATCRGGGM
jgi:hypothetical protein